MSIEKVRAYFEHFGIADRIREFDVSSATVELAAVAVGVEGARIAKSMSFKLADDEPIIIVTAGDRKIDNAKYKAYFHVKAKMLTFDEACAFTGHAPGGVCSFALPENVKTYLDVSLKRFDTVFPATSVRSIPQPFPPGPTCARRRRPPRRHERREHMSVKIVHAADFHLDSAFGALSAEQARQRRRESRELLTRLSNYVNQNGVDLVLLAGDLFDSDTTYRETLEALSEALGAMQARVFIAPGNHDPYSAKSPYATLPWPENVHVFTSKTVERVELPELGCAVYGAAFTAPVQDESLLAGFRALEDDFIHLMVLHGDISATESRYDPLTKEQIKESGIDYLALGHTHQFGGFLREGQTTYAYSGCPEGRGFDELGEKGILTGTVERGKAELSFVPFARRRYEILNVDVTGRSAEDALRAALPDATVRDIYRIIFTGETDERGLDLKSIEEQFAPDFFHLELRDETRIGEDVWARAQEDSLRGLFLRELRTKFDVASSDDERAKISLAARFGLAALDGCDL